MLFSLLDVISTPSWIFLALMVVEAIFVIAAVVYWYRDRLPRYYRRLVNKYCLLPTEHFWFFRRPIGVTHYTIADSGAFFQTELCLGLRPKKLTTGDLLKLAAVVGDASGPQTVKMYLFVVSKDWTLVEDRGFLIRDQQGGHLYIEPSLEGDPRGFCKALKDAQEFKSSDSYAIPELRRTLLEVAVARGVPTQVTAWVNEYVQSRRHLTLGDHRSASELDSSSSPREA